MNTEPNRRRPALRRAAFLLLLVALTLGLWLAMVHPRTPLPQAWNPMAPLDVTDATTPLTGWKLRTALSGRNSCLAALQTGAVASVLPDFEKDARCHIRPQVQLSQVGQSALNPIKTRCQTALRLAMWDRHGIAPAARTHLGTEVTQILHFSSYNCRQMRTTSGGSGRMSTHATADAIDISGFVLGDGRKVTLLKGWNGTPAERAFLRAVRDSACTWFPVTLGPEYNALHANHFHLQHTGWGLCR